MSNTIIVGMADLNVARGGDILTTLGLGSCVGITLYDPLTRIGGMAHIMLPDSRAFSATESANKAKFADTAIAALLQKLVLNGANRATLIAKIAGGANMFALARTDVIKVGIRNAQAVRDVLRSYNLPLVADETGGTYGRTILLNTGNGELTVRVVGRGEKSV